MLKQLLFSMPSSSSPSAHIGLLIGRLGLGLTIAFAHGMGKLPPAQGLVDGVAAIGFPMPYVFAWCAALSEFLGGIFLALGLFARPSAAALSFTMAVAAFLVHANDPFSKKEFAMVYLFGFLIILFTGPGRYSLDSLITRRK
jgi:putative oxidoreductase